MSLSGKIELFLCFSVILLSASCKEKAVPVSDDMEVFSVASVKVVESLLDDSLNSFGTISYKSKNDVTALVSGTVQKIYVCEGDSVRKGQILAVLRNVQLEIQKEQAKSGLDSARAALLVAESQLQDAKLSVESRILGIDKSELTIRQKELERDSEKKNYENKKKLNEMGGVTDLSLEQLDLQLKASQTDIDILKKEREISLLGLRKEDLQRNGYEPSENEVDFKRQLVELNTASARAQLSAAKAQLSQAEQQLDSANKLIDELTIRAPSDGIIGAKYYETGDYVKENEKIFTLIDTSKVNAVIYIQEQDMVNFSIGTPVKINIPSLKIDIDTKISEISPIADAQSGNFSIKSEIENKSASIKPGMFIKCSIQKSNTESYPCFPSTAAFQVSDDSVKFFTVVNGYAVQKNGRLLAQKNGMIWVGDGANAGDIIIDKPSPFLKEGQKVAVH